MPVQTTQFKKIPSQDWPAIFLACKDSGQSQKAFCQERGIGFSQFKYHYYRVAKKFVANDTLNINTAKIEGKAPVLFSPLKITHTTDAHTEIRFPSG
jgi:hypothetical protein